MVSISNTISLLTAQSVNLRNGVCDLNAGNAANMQVLCFRRCQLRWGFQKSRGFKMKVVGDSSNSSGGEQVEDADSVGFASEASGFDGRMDALRVTSSSLPSILALVRRNAGSKYAMVIYIASTFVLIVARLILPRKKIQNQHGSVPELVKRGQLRSDRRGVTNPLKYQDPFNNPQVKIEKDNSKVEMCGKVYLLAPVTLTQEEQLTHQQRRSQAYQWKRPTIFLKEGDLVPADVDPDTIRWIPANHPFATTSIELDESLAQSNVFQKDGVPYRVRAEHEALQKKLENPLTPSFISTSPTLSHRCHHRGPIAESPTGSNDCISCRHRMKWERTKSTFMNSNDQAAESSFGSNEQIEASPSSDRQNRAADPSNN